jgi:hypothetical protein
MRQFRCLLLVFLAVCGAACRQGGADENGRPGWELKPPEPGAGPVTASEPLQGIYPVGSRLPDRDALGGFGPCDNYPMDLGEKDWGANGTIALVAFPDESVAYFKHRGLALRVVNRTSKVVALSACDSCLFIVQEAFDKDGRWREIETLPDAICGNSFHRVFLKPGQFWQFPARVYGGPVETKIRFRLNPDGEGNQRELIYSNEFEGQVAAVQLAGR